MNFITKMEGSNVSINPYELEGVFSIEWDFYTEMREWGVKDIGVYANKVVGVIYKNDESVLEEERREVNSEDKGWTIDTDTSSLEFGHCVSPKDIYIDLESKIITVYF
tara:strand:+ start:210 stop:533 length:324 start_codon:yes stop_codon:yes gene_type:complete